MTNISFDAKEHFQIDASIFAFDWILTPIWPRAKANEHQFGKHQRESNSNGRELTDS